MNDKQGTVEDTNMRPEIPAQLVFAYIKNGNTQQARALLTQCDLDHAPKIESLTVEQLINRAILLWASSILNNQAAHLQEAGRAIDEALKRLECYGDRQQTSLYVLACIFHRCLEHGVGLTHVVTTPKSVLSRMRHWLSRGTTSINDFTEVANSLERMVKSKEQK